MHTMLEHSDITPVQVDNLDTHKHDWKPLFFFSWYRFIVITIFITSVAVNTAPSFLGEFDRQLFLTIGGFYIVFSTLCFFTIRHRWPPFSIQVIGQILIDILTITLLMHASGGVNSGFGMLLVVAVAGGSLLTEGRTAIFFAAVASLCVLIHVTLADIYHWFDSTSYTHASMLGITFFATAILGYVLARRVRISEALAKQRGVDLQYMAQLNAQIVQHIQSGIVVIDVVGRIRLFNEAARHLLGLNEQPIGRTLVSVAPELTTQVTKWQENNLPNAQLFRPSVGEVDVIATFTRLSRAGAVSVLIVLEDATLTTQRAQQLKLASLGRLTASIAHEIRNPLGAISHAGQLLAESPRLSLADNRLVQIITGQSQRVNTIVENVLELSRRGQTYTQHFDLQAWLHTFIEEYIIQQGLTSQDIVIHTTRIPVIVRFDPTQLYQVVGNLCDNGLRYTQGTPRLELTIGNSGESNRPYLDVRDQGHGMTQEIAAQIFEPFFTTEAKGTGLGLYIAREICEANQASLHLLANTPNGCCFRIHFTGLET